MAPRYERGIRQILDIQQTRSVVVEEIAGRGGPVRSPLTVSCWRTNNPEGTYTAHRTEEAESMGLFGKASKKNQQFLQVIQTGITIVDDPTNQKTRGKHIGLTRKIGSELGLTSEEIKRVFNLMRADIIYTQISSGVIPESVLEQLNQAVTKFKEDHPLNTDHKSPLTQKLHDEKWDGTVKGFYDILSQGGNATVSTWQVYELPVFQTWYLEKSKRNYPTGFDAIVVGAWDEYHLTATAESLQKQTGISLNEYALSLHVQALSGILIPKKEDSSTTPTPSETHGSGR